MDLDLNADAEELRQGARDWMTAQAPAGYVIDRLIDWLLGAVARMAAEIVVLAGRVPISIFQTFGERVLRVPALDATAATGTAIFTLADTLGHTLDEGAQLDVDGIAFVTTAPGTAAAGESTITVPIAAVIAGEEGSGLSGAAELVSPTYVWVSSVALSGITIGGRDGEDGDQYADRLADELPTLSPKAILISDYEAIARRDLEVYRALAIDNFVPPSTTGVEGAVTVALQDEAGEAVSTAAKTRVEAALEDSRVLNVDVHVIDATYTTVQVAFTATIRDGYDPATVIDEAEAAVADFLSPSNWGRGDAGDPETWVDEPTVLRTDLIWAVRDVPGVRHVTALTLATEPGTLGTADIALTGPAALTRPGTISGTAA